MSSAAEWVVQGNALGLLRSGTFAIPSADEIFRSVVEGVQVWPDVPPGKSGAATALKIGRYPLAIRLVLEANTNPVRVATRLVGTSIKGAMDLPLGLPAADHVVVGDTWYPVDPSSRSELEALLPGATSGPGEVRSLRSFLDLRQAARTNGPVEDRIEDSNIAPLLFVPAAANAPRGVTATLYPYQHDGWRWLRFLASERMGGVLADEMGLGKTLQVISLLSDPGPASFFPALIIAPGSLLENWRREIGKFASHLRVLKHHGAMRTGRPQELSSWDVVVTSYDTIVRDGGMFGMIEWPIVVLDEAQYIRNPDATRTAAVKALRRVAAFAVTGTPMENRLTDLWSILDFVLPGFLGAREEFSASFDDSVDGAARLEQFISPVLLRRRVADVANDLPARIDIPQAIELDPQEAEAYERVRLAALKEFDKAGTLVALTRLRMFCAWPGLAHEAVGAAGFSKLERLKEILEEIFSSRQKVIIFTSYTEMADLIAATVKSGWSVFAGCLDGRLPIDDRQPLIDRFAAVEGPAALVLNPKAGGAGLNITAANHVIHYNLEWNPAVEDQASARAHRRGQTLPVTVHRLYCAGTVEEVVNDRATRKRELSQAAVVGITGAEDDYADIVMALERTPARQSG